MNLNLNINLIKNYKSKSQIARVLTEAWFDKNMYCPGCTSDSLDRLQDNTKVLDFQCPRCEETYQLKSSLKKFGNTITNSEYFTKIRKIKLGESPNWALLQYSPEQFTVLNLVIIPKYFMTLNAIQKRNPLSDKARRAGWVGSNVLLNRLPPDARLYVIENNKILNKNIVRNNWKRFEFLQEKNLDAKGWVNDILSCVRELDKKEFTLQEFYSFESKLQQLHPTNKHVRDKIRQQLQILRDNDILEFVKRGRYRVIN